MRFYISNCWPGEIAFVNIVTSRSNYKKSTKKGKKRKEKESNLPRKQKYKKPKKAKKLKKVSSQQNARWETRFGGSTKHLSGEYHTTFELTT